LNGPSTLRPSPADVAIGVASAFCRPGPHCSGSSESRTARCKMQRCPQARAFLGTLHPNRCPPRSLSLPRPRLCQSRSAANPARSARPRTATACAPLSPSPANGAAARRPTPLGGGGTPWARRRSRCSTKRARPLRRARRSKGEGSFVLYRRGRGAEERHPCRRGGSRVGGGGL
jgi:hypothetical protein